LDALVLNRCGLQLLIQQGMTVTNQVVRLLWDLHVRHWLTVLLFSRRSDMLKTHRTLVRLTVATILVSVLAACGGGGSSSDTTAGWVDPLTTTPPVPGYPLTGLPITDQAAALRVALVAKIDNHPGARPQTGLNKADIVFEENVESLTRFAAVFQSQGSDPVGPLRSGRTQDIDILASLNKPLFAWSGGNYLVTKAINASNMVNVGYSASRGKGGYYREKTMKAPHNLFAKTSNLWTLAPAGSSAPKPQFLYRSDSDAKPSTSTAIDGAKVSMYNVRVYWKWDAATGNFLRSSDNEKRVLEPHMADDGQVNTKNVVVLYVTYVRSKADRKSPNALTTGKGTGFVMTDGGIIPITWLRGNRNVPFSLIDANNQYVRLTPGRTWVELAWKNSLAPVAPGIDPAKVPVPAV